MPQPLMEPAVLVSENCADCEGTGNPQTVEEEACGGCEGDGRIIREVPLSELHTMMEAAHSHLVAPPPSSLGGGS